VRAVNVRPAFGVPPDVLREPATLPSSAHADIHHQSLAQMVTINLR
jgi:hypothetical protein